MGGRQGDGDDRPFSPPPWRLEQRHGRGVPHGGCRRRRRRHRGRRRWPLTAPRRWRHRDRVATRRCRRGPATAATGRERAPPRREASAPRRHCWVAPGGLRHPTVFSKAAEAPHGPPSPRLQPPSRPFCQGQPGRPTGRPPLAPPAGRRPPLRGAPTPAAIACWNRARLRLAHVSICPCPQTAPGSQPHSSYRMPRLPGSRTDNGT